MPARFAHFGCMRACAALAALLLSIAVGAAAAVALPVKSDLHFAILKRFRSDRIAIPFPPHEERILGEQADA
jgi:small-conductance mechanosensitive channel